jgi:GWxTD domain-containing protein
MNRLLLLLALILSTNSLSANNLVAYFDYKTFYSPEEGSILETYLNFDGTTVMYTQAENDLVQAKLEVVIIISKGATEIVDYVKKEVTSPSIKSLEYVNFLDQNRFLLPDGDYNIEIKIKDLNDPEGKISLFKKSVRLLSEKNKPFFSDIQLLAGYREAQEGSTLAKSGYDLLPYLSNFYSNEFSEMMFYVEAYNIDKKVGANEQILLSYYIEDDASKTVVNNLRKFSKVNASPVISQIGSFKIDKLYSGTYNVIVEVRDSENKLLSKTKSKILRQKSKIDISLDEEQINQTFVGAMNNRDSLEFYIKSARPISESDDLNFIRRIEEFDIIKLKSFLFSFWLDRNQTDPEGAWLAYYEKVKIANRLFDTRIKHGFDTDMGRIYLKYGKPSSMHAELSPEDVWPYHIWHYYDSDFRFVFYAPQFIQSEFYLLHSNLVDGVANPRWVGELYQARYGSPYDDLDQLRNNNKYKELFNNPRNNFSLFP